MGSRLPAGGSKFAYNDRAARASFGLPATGKISNGTVKSFHQYADTAQLQEVMAHR